MAIKLRGNSTPLGEVAGPPFFLAFLVRLAVVINLAGYRGERAKSDLCPACRMPAFQASAGCTPLEHHTKSCTLTHTAKRPADRS